MMEQPPLQFSMEEMEEEEVARRRARGLLTLARMVRVVPDGVLLPLTFHRLANSYCNFKFRNDDTLLMTFPKCGTVWSIEMLWAMRHLDRLHLDSDLAYEKIYFIDRDMWRLYQPGDGSDYSRRFLKECPGARWEDGVVVQLAAAHQGSPRLIATHLPFSLFTSRLLDTCKVIYVTRNPKDVCFSSHNFLTLMGNTTGSLSDNADFFMAGDLMYGSFWGHLRQAHERRGHQNLHIMFYEDLKSDQLSELRKICNFLQLDLSDDQLQRVAEYTSLEEMRAREKGPILDKYETKGSFFPCGRAGGWKDAVTPDLDARMDQWIKNESRDIDINFRYK